MKTNDPTVTANLRTEDSLLKDKILTNSQVAPFLESYVFIFQVIRTLKY